MTSIAPRWELRPGGIEWLANGRPVDWKKRNGKPSLYAIARDAGINNATLTRLVNGEWNNPGNKLMAALATLGAESRDISPEDAQARIFRIVVPQDVSSIDDERVLEAA